ncbi:hypothetical protein [Streptomyces acidiscabies]|uniref:Uncharacterized protein n=1 Tax=Streptomyces acidiscabies TaxID=42234 RepID=A0AAP6EKW5_9ACTN|nr:hypothetical protein [Streptomyces acidiscabies]MBZ3918128.1 hypothetical protein [Streptomyces acidiscabies]MDX2966423.1 hypothetical protein [Streptomyces acidiscabies]MDX3796420.1 hypothetical protein [Streptomyces acidiscabies]
MVPVPDPRKTPLTDAEAEVEALRLITDAYRPAPPAPVQTPTATSFRDPTPVPAIGTAPPERQPGRAPMSQGATDASVLMLAGAGSVSMVSVSAGILMYLSQYADPVVCGIVLGAPTVVVLALCRLVRRAKEAVAAAPPVIHQHYEGTVHQDHSSYSTETRGLIARTRNEIRR